MRLRTRRYTIDKIEDGATNVSEKLSEGASKIKDAADGN